MLRQNKLAKTNSGNHGKGEKEFEAGVPAEELLAGARMVVGSPSPFPLSHIHSRPTVAAPSPLVEEGRPSFPISSNPDAWRCFSRTLPGLNPRRPSPSPRPSPLDSSLVVSRDGDSLRLLFDGSVFSSSSSLPRTPQRMKTRAFRRAAAASRERGRDHWESQQQRMARRACMPWPRRESRRASRVSKRSSAAYSSAP